MRNHTEQLLHYRTSYTVQLRSLCIMSLSGCFMLREDKGIPTEMYGEMLKGNPASRLLACPGPTYLSKSMTCPHNMTLMEFSCLTRLSIEGFPLIARSHCPGGHVPH
jgi:hypothetical protein